MNVSPWNDSLIASLLKFCDATYKHTCGEERCGEEIRPDYLKKPLCTGSRRQWLDQCNNCRAVDQKADAGIFCDGRCGQCRPKQDDECVLLGEGFEKSEKAK